MASPKNIPEEHPATQLKANSNQGKRTTVDSPIIRVEQMHLASTAAGNSTNSKSPPWLSPGEQKPQSDTDAGGENRPTLPRMRLDRRNMYTGHRICRSPSPPAPKRQPDAVERRRFRCRRGSRLEFALFYCSERKSRETARSDADSLLYAEAASSCVIWNWAP